MAARRAQSMTAQSWNTIKDVFHRVVGASTERRDEILEAYTGDSLIAVEVRRLIAEYDQASSFLESPCSIVPELRAMHEQSDHRFQPGQIVCERFEIQELIGRGGMGAVYAAYDRRLQERVALKTLRPGLRFDTQRIDMLIREVRAGRKVTD